MEHDDALFSWEPTGVKPELIERMKIRDYQVVEIRQALNDVGVVTQDERKDLIQACASRPLDGLRDLYADEVQGVLVRIRASGSVPEQRTGSAWDNRDEDTWIDKL